MVYFTLFSVGSSLNIGDRACASLTLVGIARDTDVCVRVCLCASVRVCVCVHVLTFCVCVSQAALSVSCCSELHLLTFCVSVSGCFVCLIYLFLRGTKYISVTISVLVLLCF